MGMVPKGSNRIGFIASCFDPFPHPGHVWAMSQAVEACDLDEIVIALHIDPTIERPAKRKPALTVEERMYLLWSIKWVRRSPIPYNTEAELYNILKAVAPDVRILGDDYKDKTVTGDDLDIPVFYAKRRDDWSGTEFTKRIMRGF